MKFTPLNTLSILSILAVFSIPTPAQAQQIQKFYDFQWKECKAEHARFYTVIDHTDSGWHRQDFYMSEKASIQMDGYFLDSTCKIKTGKFTYAYPGKKIDQTGRYYMGHKQGLWISFYPDGMLKDSIVYDQGNPIGTSLAWYRNGYPCDSSIYHEDGSGVDVQWFDNGNPSMAGFYGAGRKKRGTWKYFHKNGELSETESYEEGKLIQKKYYDTSGAPLSNTDIHDTKATFKGGSEGWLNYLHKHLIFPPQYKIVNTDMVAVVVDLTIGEDGTVEDAYISVPFTPEFDRAVIAAVRRTPKWQPATDHNRKVKAYLSQPVIFSQPDDQ